MLLGCSIVIYCMGDSWLTIYVTWLLHRYKHIVWEISGSNNICYLVAPSLQTYCKGDSWLIIYVTWLLHRYKHIVREIPDSNNICYLVAEPRDN